MTTATLTAEPGIATVGDYFALLKPRVMSLVVFTGLAGIVVAPGAIHPLTAFTALLCIAIAAGASGALNMAYDSDIDALMTRTAESSDPVRAHRARRGARLRLDACRRRRDGDGPAGEHVRGSPSGLHDLRLCRRLHALAQAQHAAEHRDRWFVRCAAAGDRLGRGDGLACRLRRFFWLRSYSFGRRRISGRCRFGAPAITRAPACR